MMIVNILPDRHRNFDIGYMLGRHGYLAAWRRKPEDLWTEGHVYVDSIQEIPRLAAQCIEFQLICEAHEQTLGRKMTMNELTAFIREHKAKNEDRTMFSVNDTLRAPAHGGGFRVWKVVGVHLGGEKQENLIGLKTLDRDAGTEGEVAYVPERILEVANLEKC